MRIAGVIQARMGSSRLPGKVVMPLADAPLLQRLVERVRASRRLGDLIVATTNRLDDGAIAELCARIGVPCHRGSEPDVLGRCIDAVAGFSPDAVLRLTGDNPMVGADLIDALIDRFAQAAPSADYATTLGPDGLPPGLTAEIITMAALRDAGLSADPADREHVTWYVRQRPERYRHVMLTSPVRLPAATFTVDTIEDYARVRPLFERLHATDPNFTLADIANALAAEPCT